QIPEWISSQKELESLDLSGNKLEGRFPHWLAEMNNIQWISLSDNNLNGQIPPHLFISDRTNPKVHLQFNGITVTRLVPK
ncbi:leucine-rich repeat-containing protein, partial [Tanacetum coccineum]